jgi:hypothetical protein
MVACSGGEPPPTVVLSEACDSCLREPGAAGCGDQYQVCLEHEACERQILCELNQRCYHRAVDSSCAEERGCDLSPNEDAQAANAADAFEACARDVCRRECEFSE